MTSEHDNSGTNIDDDLPGDALTRRRLLQRAGVLGIAIAAGGAVGAATSHDAFASATSLSLTPEQEEGPFYVAIEKLRKNVKLGQAGVPLELKIKVVDTTGKPIESAACDIWQCNALGVYSDESSENTVGQTYLRGVQLTNAAGIAEFQTIYPGHYQGRTTHIHIKVHIAGKIKNGVYSGGHVSHTGQLLFPDSTTTKVYQLPPYTSDSAARVLNGADRVYSEQGGAKTLLALTPLGSSVAAGYAAAVRLVVNPKATPAAVGM